MQLEYTQLREELPDEHEDSTVVLEDEDGNTAEMGVETLSVITLTDEHEDSQNTHLAFSDVCIDGGAWREPAGAAVDVIEELGRPAEYGWYFDASRTSPTVRSALPEYEREEVPDLSEVAIDGYIPVRSGRYNEYVLFEAESMVIIQHPDNSSRATAFADNYIHRGEASDELRETIDADNGRTVRTKDPWHELAGPTDHINQMPRNYGWNFKYRNTPVSLEEYAIDSPVELLLDDMRSNRWVDVKGNGHILVERESLTIVPISEDNLKILVDGAENESIFRDGSKFGFEYAMDVRPYRIAIDPREFEPDFLDDISYDWLEPGAGILFRMRPDEDERCGIIASVLEDDTGDIKAYQVLGISNGDSSNDISQLSVPSHNIHWWGDDAFDEITEMIGGSVGR